MKRVLAASVLSVVLLGACHGPILDAVPPAISDITRIQNDSTLTGPEKRAQLEALGLSPTLINSLLSSVRTANQFGGDLRTAYDKVVAGQFDQLTPDEVQLYADGAGAVDSTIATTLSDVQAQAIVTFFQENHISNKDELSTYLADPVQVATIPTTIPDNVLSNFFVEFDPSQLIDSLP